MLGGFGGKSVEWNHFGVLVCMQSEGHPLNKNFVEVILIDSNGVGEALVASFLKNCYAEMRLMN